MPEYNNDIQPKPVITATFKFRNNDDYEEFNELVKRHVYKTNKVFDGMQKKNEKQAWYPLNEKASQYRYVVKNKTINPRFPIYIVSKGRWTRRPTCNTLEEMRVPFKVIVENDEYENYCSMIDKENILITPKKYISEYDTFWNDADERTGPGAARNFAWDNAIENGHKWHWVMDDNIESFERFNQNKKVKCLTGAILRLCEDFVLRYENIAIAGLNYAFFCPSYEARPPVILNTRIYSCLLIRNDIPYRWRGRYNEDTDLSLRVLKDKWCTAQFNFALQGKRATQTMRGGNSETFYEKEGTYLKSKMLADMHPDVARVTKRFNRWHHYVNYKPFKQNKLKIKEDVKISDVTHDYGMELIHI